MRRLFVYGSLKSTHHNNRIMQPDVKTKLVKTGVRLPGFTLRQPSWFPGAERDPEGEGILGEVYEVTDESVVVDLDGYEGYNPAYPDNSLFIRETVEVEGIPTDIYLFNNKGNMTYPVVPNGDWKG